MHQIILDLVEKMGALSEACNNIPKITFSEEIYEPTLLGEKQCAELSAVREQYSEFLR